MGRAFEYRKERKMKRWGAMAKAFTRIGKDIAIAVKAGGGDPDTNARLRACINNAKAANMPKATVEAAIKKAISKDTAGYEELTYEGYGPHGVAIVVDTATDNPTRTIANLRTIFNKNGGTIGTSGSVEYMFKKKAMFKFNLGNLNLEELELELIDSGLAEISEEDGMVTAYAEFSDFGNLAKGLEAKGIEVIESGYDKTPDFYKELDDAGAEEMIKLIEKLEDDDDVQVVFHNMK
ncbi:MAG TPA: YebC/PmpR family DNA-binding transcriptional regulator [Chitinophagales bacterium]|nr:YebC/PmpR family DNA-binding transcriptional regulator [Chitinophagales bacterium]